MYIDWSTKRLWCWLFLWFTPWPLPRAPINPPTPPPTLRDFVFVYYLYIEIYVMLFSIMRQNYLVWSPSLTPLTPPPPPTPTHNPWAFTYLNYGGIQLAVPWKLQAQMITRHCLAGYSAGKMCAFDVRWMLACLGTVLKCEAKVWAWLAWIFFLWLKCGLLFCSVVFCDPPLLDMEGFVMFATTRFAFRRLIFMIIFVYCTVWNFHYIQPFFFFDWSNCCVC